MIDNSPFNKPPSSSAPFSGLRARAPGLKLAGIVVLTFLLGIPLFLIQSAVTERRMSADAAQSSVAQGWGGPQELAGPFLVVPFNVPERRSESGVLLAQGERGTIVLAPETFDAAIDAVTQMRSRGIYDVPVYEAKVNLSARFDLTRLDGRLPTGAVLELDKARLSLALSDPRGLTEAPKAVVKPEGLTLVTGEEPRFESGSGLESWVSGMHADLKTLAPGSSFHVQISFGLRGLNTIHIVPVGDTTKARISADWPHPSFSGSFLPVTREVSASGFTASWEVPALARAMPQVFVEPGGGYLIAGSGFGVQLFEPVDLYHSTERALKYALLFVGLAFLVFFLVETLTDARIHVVQYMLVGSAQVLFYLLLLALAEQVGFAHAYLAATAASVFLTCLYAGAIFRSRGKGFILFGVLSALYALLFAILDQEDYALLAGSAVLFVALALTMFLTRKIDWYQVAVLPTAPAEKAESRPEPKE